VRKGWNLKWQSYDQAISVFRRSGLMLYGTFVFGCDSDTTDAFNESVAFAIRNRFMLANFNPLTAMPGAPLYERMQQQGRLLHDRWWLDPDFRYGDATFAPMHMTADRLTEECFAARIKFNSVGSIVRRLLDLRTNMRSPYRAGIYLAANLISRREIRCKQKHRLGAATGRERLVEEHA
jgi:radical SAM superfamily enzyme YgiQ (UPF0313 family)